MENISPKLVKDIENSRFRSWSRDFYQFLEGFGIGFGEFGLGKKSRFWFRKIWSQKKSLGFGFGKFGIGKKVSVSVSVKILVSSFSDEQFIFHKKGVSNKPQNMCQKKLALFHSRPVQIGLNLNL